MTHPTGWAPRGSTTVAAVIGSPVRHSLSPVLFNAGFRELGLDWVYVAHDVAPGHAAAAVDAMRVLGWGGCSVTMPHKAAVAASVDELDEAAALLGAVNCVVPLPDGRLLGRNTDGPGFVEALQVDAGVALAGERVVLLGAGGAARAVGLALARAGVADLCVVNRDGPRAAALVAMVDGAVPGAARVGSEADVPAAAVVVNATSVGMAGTPTEGTSPVPASLLRREHVVADLVYHPVETPLLAAARAAGARPVDGVGMLLHQAALAFTHWTGHEAPLAAMRAAMASSPG